MREWMSRPWLSVWRMVLGGMEKENLIKTIGLYRKQERTHLNIPRITVNSTTFMRQLNNVLEIESKHESHLQAGM